MMSLVTEKTFTDAHIFDAMAAAEDRHFWFRARNRVIERVVKQLSSELPRRPRALEVGSGTGNVLRVLERACPDGIVIGIELYQQGLKLARTRTACPLIRGDVFHLPVKGPFDLVGMFDVLEHLENDRLALQRLRKIVAPGGRLVLTVPAYMSLWSTFDMQAGHQRRYTPTSLEAVLGEAGFRVEYVTPFMAVLAPLMWLARRGPSSIDDPSTIHEQTLKQFRVVPVANEIMYVMLCSEIPLISCRLRLPLGSSLLAIAR